MNPSESNSLTFPVKLKWIVDDPETDHLIYWDEDGLSFHIEDENQLASEVFPKYFKHTNISSFIRQLNMYGFHKINRIENGLAVMGTGKNDSHWSHPNFIRDNPDLLQNVERRPAANTSSNALISRRSDHINEPHSIESLKNDIAHLAKAVHHLKQRDEETSDKLKTLQEENHQLYSVLMYLREEHDKQSKLIDILIKFFSLYANNPQDTRLKSKRVFAIEMPDSNSSNSTINEPPKKFLVTSPSGSPQVSISNHNNNSFKGKKVIKITPTSILNNNRICGIPNINSQSNQKPTPIYSLSLPKTKNSIVIPNRAITSSANGKPTFIIPQPKSLNQHNVNNANNPVKKPAPKTVTVSSIDSIPDNTFNAQLFNYPNSQTTSNASGNTSSNDNSFFDLEEFITSQIKPETYLSTDGLRSSTPNNHASSVSKIVSDISANVSSVGQSLNNFAKFFTSNRNNFSTTNASNSSNLTHIEFDESSPVNIEEIPYDNFNDNLIISDHDTNQGNELIPFNNSLRNECQEPVYNYQDNFSIDDLLQTPEIHPEELSPSLDGLKNSLMSHNYFDDLSG